MQLNVTLQGQTQLIQRLEQMPSAVHAVLKTKIWALTLQLEAKIKGKVSGPVLRVRTGALRRSIHSTIAETETSVIGKVASSGDVKYAAIHEFGGRTKAHEIYPTKAKALSFMVGGKRVFASVVHHPGSQMPERSFMRSSLREMSEQISREIKESVVRSMQQSLQRAA